MTTNTTTGRSGEQLPHAERTSESLFSRINKPKTAGASLFATLAGSVAFSLFNPHGELPGLTIHDDGYIYTSSTYTEGIPYLHTDTVTSQVTHPPISNESFDVSRMPYARSFELAEDPEAQRFIGESNLDEYASHILKLIAEGYVIKDVTIVGYASDEALGTSSPEAGVGMVNVGNEELALDRAHFLLDALKSQMGYNPAIDAAILSGEEVVLDQQVASTIVDLGKAYGYESTESFLYAYDLNQVALSTEDAKTLDAYIGSKRGATITMSLEFPETSETTHYSEAICIQHDVVYKEEHEVQGLNFTFVPLLVPIIRRKRRDEAQQQNQQTPQTIREDQARRSAHEVIRAPRYVPTLKTDAEKEDFEVLKTNPAYDRFAGTFANDQQLGAFLGSLPEDFVTWTHKHQDSYVRRVYKELDRIDNRRYYLKDSASEKARRIGARMGRAAFLIAPLALLQMNFGYCPEPDETTHNPFRLDAPEYVDIQLRVPFTDIESDVLILSDIGCPAPDKDGDSQLTTRDGTVCVPDEIRQTITTVDIDGNRTVEERVVEPVS